MSLLLLASTISTEAQEPDIPLPPSEHRVDAVNDFHTRLGSRIFQISERVDDFFGDRRLEDEPVETRMRIRTQLR